MDKNIINKKITGADNKMEGIKEKLKELLRTEKVRMVIGYGQKFMPVVGDSTISTICPVFLTKEEGIDQLVWNRDCVQNLTTYLTKKEYMAHEKIAIFVKPCDLKAINVLCQENQIKRQNLFIIGLTCNGVMSKKMGINEGHLPTKCMICLEQYKDSPATCRHEEVDIVLESLPSGEQPPKNEEVLTRMKNLKGMTPDERWQFWQTQFQKCLRCYACRSVCPLCYCVQCISDMSQPQWLYKSPHLKGNFLFHITRAYHLVGRCVGCGECERVCPMGIHLTLLNRYLIDLVKDIYDYESGRDMEETPLLSQFKVKDDQSFIK